MYPRLVAPRFRVALAGPERLAGTLAAVGFGVRAGAHLLRLHDIAAAADFLAVAAVLEGTEQLASELRLSDALRWAQPDQSV